MNPYKLALTAPSKLRVYQFHHPGEGEGDFTASLPPPLTGEGRGGGMCRLAVVDWSVRPIHTLDPGPRLAAKGRERHRSRLFLLCGTAV